MIYITVNRRRSALIFIKIHRKPVDIYLTGLTWQREVKMEQSFFFLGGGHPAYFRLCLIFILVRPPLCLHIKCWFAETLRTFRDNEMRVWLKSLFILIKPRYWQNKTWMEKRTASQIWYHIDICIGRAVPWRHWGHGPGVSFWDFGGLSILGDDLLSNLTDHGYI